MCPGACSGEGRLVSLCNESSFICVKKKKKKTMVPPTHLMPSVNAASCQGHTALETGRVKFILRTGVTSFSFLFLQME
jgi:hypothetical protein